MVLSGPWCVDRFFAKAGTPAAGSITRYPDAKDHEVDPCLLPPRLWPATVGIAPAVLDQGLALREGLPLETAAHAYASACGGRPDPWRDFILSELRADLAWRYLKDEELAISQIALVWHGS